MFSRLVASAKGRSQFRNPAVIVASILVHALVLAAAVWASAPEEPEAEQEIDPEDVTYIDIAEVPPPDEEVFEEPEEPPPPQQTAPPPRIPPRTPRPVTEPDLAQGTQELQTPPDVIGIPEPDRSAAPVEAEDFSGRGELGGVAGGTPPPEQPEGAGEGGPPTGTFSANLVDRRAELINQSTVVAALRRNYPSSLRDSGVEGSVRVQFVVTADGRVDMSSVQILQTSHPLFAEATRRVLREFRFRPARKGDHNVRMLTMIPIDWKIRD